MLYTVKALACASVLCLKEDAFFEKVMHTEQIFDGSVAEKLKQVRKAYERQKAGLA